MPVVDGYKSNPQAFVDSFFGGQSKQISDMMVAAWFNGNSQAVSAANSLDFLKLATRYNGSRCCGAGSHNYDIKLKEAYEQALTCSGATDEQSAQQAANSAPAATDPSQNPASPDASSAGGTGSGGGESSSQPAPGNQNASPQGPPMTEAEYNECIGTATGKSSYGKEQEAKHQAAAQKAQAQQSQIQQQQQQR